MPHAMESLRANFNATTLGYVLSPCFDKHYIPNKKHFWEQEMSHA